MLEQAITTAMVPVRAMLDGSPILARRLLAPVGKRRATAAEERARIQTALAEGRAEQLAKLTGKARAAALQTHAEEDRAARKERRGRRFEVAAIGVVVAAVGGPVVWTVVGPWVPTAVSSGIALWWIAAMAHAPKQTATTKDAPAETASTAPEQDPDDGEWIQEDPEPAVLWALVRHVAAQSDQGTAAHLPDLLAEGQRRGEFDGWTKTDLKALLTVLGVPVIEKKKLTFAGQQRTRQAVLLADLPEVDPAPVPAIVQSTLLAAAKGAA
ncbi:hypothetical protein [Kitasatospora sp. NPDC001132]